MKISRFLAALGGAGILVGCGTSPSLQNNSAASAPPPTVEMPVDDTNAGADAAPPATEARTPGNAADAGNAAAPDLSPPVLVPEAERGVTGARNVLLSFARRIEQKQFEHARAMLSEGDRQRWSRAQFARQFADLDRITVAVPTGTTEGAAGSLYYTAPVTITATDKDGRPVRIEGEAVLRRVNDVDGATPAQLRWHFDRLTLNWTH